jgi:predicted DNA-binding transcriptional regulator YafY
VRFDASGLDWASGWVLSYGSAARVLEPPELIERVQTEAQNVLKRYQS